MKTSIVERNELAQLRENSRLSLEAKIRFCKVAQKCINFAFATSIIFWIIFQ